MDFVIVFMAHSFLVTTGDGASRRPPQNSGAGKATHTPFFIAALPFCRVKSEKARLFSHAKKERRVTFHCRPLTGLGVTYESGVTCPRCEPPGVGVGVGVTGPPRMMRPMALPLTSPNQMFPSGPSVIPSGCLPIDKGNSVKIPLVVMRVILLAFFSVNQRFPSGPVVMSLAPEFVVGMEYSWVTFPFVVIRPI